MNVQIELMSVVKMRTTFCPILRGSNICVVTHHSNLPFTQLSLQQVLRWQVLKSMEFRYPHGINNVEAVMLSRYPCLKGEKYECTQKFS